MSENVEIVDQDNSIATTNSEKKENVIGLIKYSLVGIVFGIVFVKAEIISWFRIQEMFKLQSFHMYGVIPNLPIKVSCCSYQPQ